MKKDLALGGDFQGLIQFPRTLRTSTPLPGTEGSTGSSAGDLCDLWRHLQALALETGSSLCTTQLKP